ncbi:MAG: hypothetical protein ACYC2G_01135 [Gemmatimonadaceae bacterium]
MARQTFRDASFVDATWGRSYVRLTAQQQKQVDKVVVELLKGSTASGLQIKPIQPSKRYYEARVNQGDRVIFQLNGNVLTFVDIIPHDDIDRYGR